MRTVFGLWTGLSSSDWATLASMATLAGLGIATLGGLVALRSYRAANRAADNAHMHSLFRDYLRARFDFQAAADAGQASTSLEAEVASIKLYVLEEMWGWVDRQRRLAHRLPLVKSLPWLRRRRYLLDAWTNTINNHLYIDMDEVIENLEQNTECYGLEFLDYLAAEFDDPCFAEMRNHQRTQAKTGKRTPFKPV